MNIRPIELPELRADLTTQLHQPHVIGRMWPDGVEVDMEKKWMEEDLARRTACAEMFHVSEAMSDLAATAAESLERFALQREDVPCENGLIIFDGQAPYEAPYDDGCKNELRGIAWYTQESGLFVIPVVLPHGDLGRGYRMAMEPGMFFLALFSDQIEELITPSGGPAFDVFGMLLTVWLLMQQPLSESSQVEVDRAARKRLRRLGQTPGPVRVIELRRPSSSSDKGDGAINYQHQWIVRGHWRQQWFPKRQVHRPVWIAPHVKGPEGAPLIGGEKVYAWKR